MLAAQAIAAKLMPQRPAPADTGSGTFAEKSEFLLLILIF
jgi:hypothetical protein